MNSSGIKRGLASSAIAALAVTGLPFLASSASAATGDSIAVASVGAVRNGGDVGGVVVLKTKGIDETKLELANTALSGGPDSATQSVAIVGATRIADKDPGDSNPNDGLDEVTLHITATTPAAGDTATFAVYEDEDNPASPAPAVDVDASEARVQMSMSTSGAPAQVTLSPSTQTVPENIDGTYDATIKDSAGRTTQLTGTEALAVAASGGTGTVTFGDDATDGSISKSEADEGVGTIKAQADEASLYTITVDGLTGVAAAHANLDVVAGADSITAADVDVVTGADTWETFGSGTNAVDVRPDQASVRFDIKSDDDKSTVAVFNLTGTGVTFGGKTSTSVSTVLDGNGVGSITVTPDAGTIAPGDKFRIQGGGAVDITVTYATAKPTTASPDAKTYLGAFKGSVDATLTVLDQYENPVTGVFATVQVVTGPNAGAESARKEVDASGKVSFTLTDAKATAANATDALTFKVYSGRFDATELLTNNASSVVWSADGQGADFQFTVDSQLPAGSAYDPNKVYANPLTDAVADGLGDSADESIALALSGGTAGAPVTVTVDNGALVLKGGDKKLSEAAASKSGVMGTDSFKIIGTKAGLVNVTVASGGRTHTAQVSVHTLSQDVADARVGVTAAQAIATARNVSLTAPAKAEAGEVAVFTAVVTDAFGNPVAGYETDDLSRIVSGDAHVQNTSDATDATGALTINVAVENDADSPVSLQVKGSGSEFGAAADRHTAASTSNDAVGLAASVDTASATISDVVNIEQLEEAVAEAQAAVDEAADNLAAAQGDLKVARAEKRVAQADVRHAKRDLRQAKRHHHGVAAARENLRDARGDLRIARAKVNVAEKKVDRRKADLAEAQAVLAAAQQALEDAQSED